MAWGSKSNEGTMTPTSSSTSAGGAMSFLGNEVVITGNVTGKGDLHIDATVDGDVACKTLILGSAGRVKGNVVAEKGSIAGAVEGTLNVGALTIERSAKISGDITYQTVSIENGAQVEGRLTQRSAAGTGDLKLVAAAE
jgi:cytoskeletal protein CcmA (bactofilin family)